MPFSNKRPKQLHLTCARPVDVQAIHIALDSNILTCHHYKPHGTPSELCTANHTTIEVTPVSYECHTYFDGVYAEVLQDSLSAPLCVEYRRLMEKATDLCRNSGLGEDHVLTLLMKRAMKWAPLAASGGANPDDAITQGKSLFLHIPDVREGGNGKFNLRVKIGTVIDWGQTGSVCA